MKGSLWCVLISFQSCLLLFSNLLSYIHFSPLYMQFSRLTIMPFTKFCFSTPGILSPSLFILQDSVERPRTFTDAIPTHYCFIPLFRHSFQLPTKYTTWLSHSLLTCPKLKISSPHKPTHPCLLPTSANTTTTFPLAKLESQAPYLAHTFCHLVLLILFMNFSHIHAVISILPASTYLGQLYV